DLALRRPALAEVELGAEAGGPADAGLGGPDAGAIGRQTRDERHTVRLNGTRDTANAGNAGIITGRSDLAVLERDARFHVVQRALVGIADLARNSADPVG